VKSVAKEGIKKKTKKNTHFHKIILLAIFQIYVSYSSPHKL